MSSLENVPSLEEQIEQWRNYLRRRQAIHSVDVAELEDHLRELIADLVGSGLTKDEAFLVAVKRMGDLDALSREFAREHSDRLWKQLVIVSVDSEESRCGSEGHIRCPSSRWRGDPDQDTGVSGSRWNRYWFLCSQFELLCLASLDRYFVWKRQLTFVPSWLAVALSWQPCLPSYPFIQTAILRDLRRCTCRLRFGW